MASTLSNKLYWKISLIFLLLLFLLGMAYVLITSYSANLYFQEANQKLHGELAKYTVDHTKTFREDGSVDTVAIQDIMHSMMIINPSVEVYLLDPKGEIITYVAPYKKIKMERVDLKPVNDFIIKKEEAFILGDDPRNPGGQKVFSAAPITVNDELKGYYYIILASEDQDTVTSGLFSSYILRVGANLFLVTLIGALIIGLLSVWFLTRNLRGIIQTVQRFKEGDMTARVLEKDRGDLSVLADTYNEMADRIVENIDDLKAVENLRRELIANVSHDLRTPLAIMQGYAETMLMKEETIKPEERKRYLEIILNSSEKLSKLVAQLFEYSKLEAKQIQPHKEPFFITELAQDVYSKYQILAEEKGIQMDLNMSRGLPMVFADIGLVERVMQNLMDNALKFTPRDGKVSINLLEDGKNQVKIKISDTGPGIPKEEQSYIFERYHKSTNAATNTGAGLGLAIVKKILEIHNSTIEIQSKPNQGASFLFNLPVYQA